MMYFCYLGMRAYNFRITLIYKNMYTINLRIYYFFFSLKALALVWLHCNFNDPRLSFNSICVFDSLSKNKQFSMDRLQQLPSSTATPLLFEMAEMATLEMCSTFLGSDWLLLSVMCSVYFVLIGELIVPFTNDY